MARLVACLLLLVTVHAARHNKYEGYKLYRIGGPADEIAHLEAKLDILSAIPAARSTSGQLEALVRLSPEEIQQWLEFFEKEGFSYTKIADNLADILRQDDVKISRSKVAIKNDDVNKASLVSVENSEQSTSEESSEESSAESNEESNEESDGWSIQWDTYYRHEEINNFIDELGAKYPNLVTVVNADLSYEGRQIKYVRISTSRFENHRKPVIIIDATIHAREWITTPVAMYIINQLVVDIADSDLTERLDWVIIPIVNPDGYEYSIDEDRLWRKTRSRSHPGSLECPGVDGNRNFDHYWGINEGAADPCSIIYEGPTPFSEPETRVIRNVVMSHLSRTTLYITLHSYGNMFLYAWGNNGTLPSNGLSLHLVGVRMAEAIDALALEKAEPYIVGNAAQVLYFTTGTSRDWTRAVGIPLTYTLELPGYEYDFLVPPEYIKQVITETWAGIAEGAHYVLSLYN